MYKKLKMNWRIKKTIKQKEQLNKSSFFAFDDEDADVDVDAAVVEVAARVEGQNSERYRK